MFYKLKADNTNLTASQAALAKKLGISERFCALLLGRGLKEEELYGFLHPSVDRLASPFEIEGMSAARDRILRAVNNRERVLIYGDYDCDGICAISILMLYLKGKLNVSYFIPDRNKDGYGITVDALKGLIARHKPDLIVTVDCGITAAEEVKFLKQNGIDVIVTDHHEPQEVLPDCIAVDPKIKRNGFYDLCGAGVALKLVEALSDRATASAFLDIAAIATIADVVPLKDDNRIIAYYGLKQITKNARKGIKMLLGQDRVSSQDVMFKLAPRMNAAGRLNSAMKVVGLFLEDDYFMLKTLSEELMRDNAARQELCERVVDEAKAMLRGVDFCNTRIIALYSDGWEAGVLGIAAARLVDEFKRPTVLFAKHGDELKGSARSVRDVNIFELFSKLSQYFTTFGGHSQAAGVGMKATNFDAFCNAANEELCKTCGAESFFVESECEMELPLTMDFLSFAKELELLEPTGYCNPKPHFLVRGEGLKFERIGFSNHVKCALNNIDLIGFSRFSECLYPKTGDAEFEICLGVNCFQNILTAQGIIQSVGFSDIAMTEGESLCLNVHQMCREGHADIERIDVKTVEGFLNEPFGTAILCFSKREYDSLCAVSEVIATLPVCISSTRCLNPENCVIVCPSKSFDSGFFARVIIAGSPLCEGYVKYIADLSNKAFMLEDCAVKPTFVSDDTLRDIIKALYAVSAEKLKIGGMHRLWQSVSSRTRADEATFALAMQIFSELDLVSISERGVLSVSRKSVCLSDSATYRNLAK